MSVSVEHAQLLINSPSTVSEAVVGITKADIQPSGSAVAFASVMALTAAQLDVDGSVLALQWEQDTLTISVDAAAITISAQQIEGRRGTPVLTGTPTISGQEIALQLSSGDWSLAVDSGIPTILGRDIVLEDNRFFVAGVPILSPSSVVLSENAVVASTGISFTGSDITLTWSQGTAGVLHAAFDIDGQEIGLNKTWSLAVDSASFDIDGQEIIFDWVVPATVVVGHAQFSAVGSSFNLARHIPVSSTALSFSGQPIGRSEGTIVETAAIEFLPHNVELLFDYILGYAFDPAQPQIIGKDVTLFLGDGRPTRVRSEITSDHIEISFSRALANVITSESKIV